MPSRNKRSGLKKISRPKPAPNPLKQFQPKPPADPLKAMQRKLGRSSSSTKPRTGIPVEAATMDQLHQAAEQTLLITAIYKDRNDVIGKHQFFILEFNEDPGDPWLWAWQIEDATSPAGPGCFQIGRLSNITTSEAPWTVPDDMPDSDVCFGQSPELAIDEDIEP